MCCQPSHPSWEAHAALGFSWSKGLTQHTSVHSLTANRDTHTVLEVFARGRLWRLGGSSQTHGRPALVATLNHRLCVAWQDWPAPAKVSAARLLLLCSSCCCWISSHTPTLHYPRLERCTLPLRMHMRYRAMLCVAPQPWCPRVPLSPCPLANACAGGLKRATLSCAGGGGSVGRRPHNHSGGMLLRKKQPGGFKLHCKLRCRHRHGCAWQCIILCWLYSLSTHSLLSRYGGA